MSFTKMVSWKAEHRENNKSTRLQSAACFLIFGNAASVIVLCKVLENLRIKNISAFHKAFPRKHGAEVIGHIQRKCKHLPVTVHNTAPNGITIAARSDFSFVLRALLGEQLCTNHSACGCFPHLREHRSPGYRLHLCRQEGERSVRFQP